MENQTSVSVFPSVPVYGPAVVLLDIQGEGMGEYGYLEAGGEGNLKIS